jgi:M penetrans paralogue family 26
MEINQQKDYLSSQSTAQQPLPNATVSLVLGILSIVICGIGVVLGIIGIVMANKDIAMYKNNPGVYTEASFNNTKTGRICSIIGLILNSLLLLFYIAWIVFFISLASSSDGWK